MIRFEHVSKVYDDKSLPALDDVSLEVDRGEFVYLVGASGSGKSTFLQLVLREHRASSGRVLVAGKNVADLSSWKVPHLRRQMGSVFQDFRLLPNKTVAENVAFALEVLGRSRSEIQKTVPNTLEMVGLAGKERRLPHELSGGEQQRVAIARAFVNRPAIILADEPTGNLDPVTSRGIMTVLERINSTGTTIVMATHDVALVDEMRRRVIELADGHVIRDEIGGSYTTTSIPVIKLTEAAEQMSPVVIPDPEPQAAAQDLASLESTTQVVLAAEETAQAAPAAAAEDPSHSDPGQLTRRQLREQRAQELAEAEQRAEAERLETERLAAERAQAERAEAERVQAERAEAERLEAERLEAERLGDQQAAEESVATEDEPRRRGLFRRRR